MTAQSSARLSATGVPANESAGTSESNIPWHRRWLDYIHEVRHRQRSRRELLALDDRSLADIGLTRFDAEYEASKPFWQS